MSSLILNPTHADTCRSDDALPSGFWDDTGCRNLSSSETAQEIMSWECDHLTHFAILLSPRSDTVRERTCTHKHYDTLEW